MSLPSDKSLNDLPDLSLQERWKFQPVPDPAQYTATPEEMALVMKMRAEYEKEQKKAVSA